MDPKSQYDSIEYGGMALTGWGWGVFIASVAFFWLLGMKSRGGNTLSPHAFHEAIQRGEGQVIDVREPEEYRHGHIPGAINVPIGRLPEYLPRLSKDVPVLLYCQSGNRSAIAARMLKKQGFEQVYHLRGGISGWPYERING